MGLMESRILPDGFGFAFLRNAVALSTLFLVILQPVCVFGAHLLLNSSCYDCHVVGSSLADVLDQSRLIKKDERITEIQTDGVWSVGTPLPCTYCHDDTPKSVRANMIGVRNDFTTGSISSHPVNPYASNISGEGDGGDGSNNLDCVDCHTLAAVDYVGQGGTTPGTSLSPNIHEKDTGAVAWTPAPGLLAAEDTLKGGSHLNSDSNVFCTSRCHDASFTDYNSGQVLHSYSGILVSLELEVGGAANSPAGCLYEGSANPDGCHAVHNVVENTDLIAARKSNASIYGTGYIVRADCGICHLFDDPGPPSFTRSDSVWILDGHGRFETTNGVVCTSCHDASTPHFQADGSPATGSSEGRLNFVLDTNSSGFSSPPKSETSICISSNCHGTYLKHTSNASGASPTGPVVGCIDCHDPHGYQVDTNIAMMRRNLPLAASSLMYYTASGNWWDSTTPVGQYSNWVCDNRTCHGGSGPGPISSLMDTSTGTHSGGTGIKSGCETCHTHTGGPYSWGVDISCDLCHGYPPNSTNNSHANGVSAFNHDSVAITPNHQDCWYCHGIRELNGSAQSGSFEGMSTSEMKGSYAYSISVDHVDGNVTMNGDDSSHPADTANDDAGYARSGGRGFCSTGVCHAGSTSDHAFTVGSGSLQVRNLGPGECKTCHETGTNGAPAVASTITTPHMKTTTSQSSFGGCQQCHYGHVGRSGTITIPLPPASWDNPGTTATETWNMRSRLGIAYTSTGHVGIALGGSATSGSTEADICWGCHGSNTSINEWGTNTDTSPSWPLSGIASWAGSSYNYGVLYTDSSWTNGNETSAWVDTSAKGYYRKDGYRHTTATDPDYVLSQRISSVHSVNFSISAGTGSSVTNNISSGAVIRTSSQVLENRGQIRCSYCHDVHDLNKANGGTGYADTGSGPPHLRGTWFGNPYGPDMPPISTDSYPTTGAGRNAGNRYKQGNQNDYTAAFPRLYPTTSRNQGGWLIDQNAGWPTDNTSLDSLEETSGLCVLCHGTGVDTMDYWSGSMWLNSNGHSNSTLGGTGSQSGNLFYGGRGTTTTNGVNMAMQGAIQQFEWGKDPRGGFTPQDSGPYRQRFVDACSNSSGANCPPLNTGMYGGTEGATSRGSDYTDWYTSTTGIGSADGSTGPAHKFTCSKCHSPHATGMPALLITNCLDFNVAKGANATGWQATADNSVIVGPESTNTWVLRAQNNCHRNEGTTTGWHILNTKQ